MPKVPTTGPFRMFDTGSIGNPISTSIKGSQKYNAQDDVEGNTKFSENIADAQIPLFDPAYAGDIDTLDDITKSSQWRGYPQEVSCYDCSFEETGDPSKRNVTYACSVLDPQVLYNITLEGTVSAPNGSVTKQVTAGTTVTGLITNVENPPEQFIGWSFTPDGSTGILSTSTNFSRLVEEDITIYALVGLSDAVVLNFCYHSSYSLNTICGSCATTKNVYFNRVDFETNPIEDLIWYENLELTVKSDEGYYRRKSSTNNAIDDTIYFVSGSSYPTPGAANVLATCGEFIYCS